MSTVGIPPAARTVDLFAVRHGETEWNRDGWSVVDFRGREWNLVALDS